jgi:VCBS repeat-containing protein
MEADGRWTYTLDNANAAVQGLIPGETLTERVAYRITDADGDEDASTAELVITVHGSNDVPTLVVDDRNGGATGHASVAEQGLADGDGSQAVEGRFVLAAPDGLQSLGVGGTVVSAAQLAALGGSPITVATGRGLLTLTGFDPATGAVSYRYTLSAPQSHAAGAELTDDIALSVLDRDGDRVDGTLRVLVVDDAPLARDDAAQLSVSLPRATASGNVLGGAGSGAQDVADRPGADKPVAVSGFAAADGSAGTVGGGALRGTYGTLRLNADGSYVYAVDDAHPAVGALINGRSLTERFTYTVRDADGSTSSAVLVVTIRGNASFMKAGDQIFPVAYEPVQRAIAQDMNTGLFVQHAVRDSAQQSLALVAGVANGSGAFDVEVLHGELDRITQAMTQTQHVGRDGVAFSLRLAQDTQLLLAQRLSQSELTEPDVVTPQGQAAEPGNAFLPATRDEAPPPQRIVVPGAPSAPRQAAAPGFSRQLAVQGAERAAAQPVRGATGLAGGGTGTPRIRVPAARA